MAGLLAWAADVVGGGQLNSEETKKPLPLLLSAEQRHYLSTLDARAAALQQSVQVLRQRVGPGAQGLAQRMPHLLADSLSSQSALALEVEAHNATRLQIQQREASLRAENEAYASALAARQQESCGKAQESHDLEASLQELEARKKKLKDELEELKAAAAEKEVLSIQDQEESEMQAERDSHSHEELQQLKAELDTWEAKASKLEKEVAATQQSSSRWPSPAQREKELERRLRNLTEQLGIKQAQAETLASERTALELRLEKLNDARRQLHITGNVDSGSKRNKIGRVLPSGVSVGDDSKSRALPIRQRTSKAVSENVANVARKMDALSLHAGSHVWRSKLLRSLTVVYIMGLHLTAFIILSGKLHQQFGKTTPELP